MPIRILCVAGARPNFIKIAPVVRALAATAGHRAAARPYRAALRREAVPGLLRSSRDPTAGQQANETPRGIGRESQLSTLKRQWATTRAHYADFARFTSWGAHPSGRGAYKSLVFSRPDLGYVRDPPVWPEASASTPDSALRMSIPNRRDRSSAQPVASDEPRRRTRAPIPAEGRPTTRSTCSARGFLRPAAAPVGAAIGLALHRTKRAPSPSARRAAQGGTTSPAEPAAQRG